jgi:hypothetical protein
MISVTFVSGLPDQFLQRLRRLPLAFQPAVQNLLC